MNNSATLDEDGNIQLVTEDIRNGNGRAIKSKLWAPNRVDKIDEPVNAIFWIMKDPTIPPVVKLKRCFPGICNGCYSGYKTFYSRASGTRC